MSKNNGPRTSRASRLICCLRRWLFVLLAAAFLALYVHTLAPGLLPADSGEFQLVAARLGVAHPPGFPLYTLLAHWMTWLPGNATAAYKINLLSAVSSSATLWLVALTVYRLTRSHLAGIVTAVALGTSVTFWAQATTANIRSLTAFFAALAIYALVAISKGAEMKEDDGPAPPHLLTLVLALSLGVTHHASLIFMGAVFGLYLLSVVPQLLWTPRWWPRPLLAGFLGLLPLLYLPWRAAVGAYNAPADLVTWPGFLNHVLALGFRGDFFYFRETAVLWERLKVMGNVMTFQFAPLLLAGMVAGGLLLLRHNRKLAFLLGGSWALHTLITATYRAPQTVEYMLPAYVPAVILLGYAVAVLAGPAPTMKWENPDARPGVPTYFSRLMASGFRLMAYFLLLTAVYQGWRHYPSYAYLSQDHTADDYANILLAQAPPGSTILADWHWVTPLWYRQAVDGRRPDLTIHFVFPTAEPYAETWARRIAEEHASGRPVVATHFNEWAYAHLPTPEPLGEALLFRQEPRRTLPAGYEPLALTLAESVQIIGYQLEPATVEIGQDALLTVAWQPLAQPLAQLALFAHLVGFDGQIYAQQDVTARPQPAGINLTQFRLTPRPGARPGDFAVMVGAYQVAPPAGEAAPTRTAVTTLPVTPMKWPPLTHNPVYRRVKAANEPGTRLVGYDWDNSLPQPRLYLHWQSDQGYYSEVRDGLSSVTLPGGGGRLRGDLSLTNPGDSYYLPFAQGIIWTGRPLAPDQAPVTAGDTLALPQTFAASRPVTRDLAAAVRLIGYEADGFHWNWVEANEGTPAMGAIPTLKWIAGSRVRDPRRFTLPAAVYPGQSVGATLLLYDAFTGRPLAILDERISQQAAWAPLGQITAAAP